VAGLLGVSALAVAPAATATPAVTVGATVSPEEGRWWEEALHLTEVHQTVTGKGVDIALVNAPVSTDVPELQGQDVRPGGATCRAAAGSDEPAVPVAPPSTITDHATGMAVTLVGNGRGTRPDGSGVVGVSPGATLRVYATADVDRTPAGPDVIPDCQHGEALTDLELLEQILADGADIVVVPMDWDRAATLQAAVNEAIKDGVIFVVSMGNAGPDHRPLTLTRVPGVVTVAAGDSQGRFWKDNSFGILPLSYLTEHGNFTLDATQGVHLSAEEGSQGRPIVTAPGVDILVGAVRDGRWDSSVITSGTSDAGAIVAGALALAMERWPEASPEQILQSLVRNANRPEGTGYDLHFGFGGLSIAGMLDHDPTAYPDVHPFYGGLRWALVDDPPAPVFARALDGGRIEWQPTYTEDELDEPYPVGPLSNVTAASDGAGPTRDAAPDAAAHAGGDEPAAPDLTWVVAAVVGVLVLALGGLAVRQGRRGRGRLPDHDSATGASSAAHDNTTGASSAAHNNTTGASSAAHDNTTGASSAADVEGVRR
jgi:hypothetical protein